MNATILLILTINLLLALSTAWLVRALQRSRRAGESDKALNLLIDTVRKRGAEREDQLQQWLGQRLYIPPASLPDATARIRNAEKSLYKAVIRALRTQDPALIGQLHQPVEALLDSLYELPAAEPVATTPAATVDGDAPGPGSIVPEAGAAPDADVLPDDEPLSDMQHTVIDRMFHELGDSGDAGEPAEAVTPAPDDAADATALDGPHPGFDDGDAPAIGDEDAQDATPAAQHDAEGSFTPDPMDDEHDFEFNLDDEPLDDDAESAAIGEPEETTKQKLRAAAASDNDY